MADNNLSTALTDPEAPAAPNIGNAGQDASQLASVTRGASDLPRFQRTFGNTLKGMLIGFGLGGVPGAIAGGVAPAEASKVLGERHAMAQANITFQNAKAAHETAMASLAQQQADTWSQEQKDLHAQREMDLAKTAKDTFGMTPVAVVPLDGDVQQNEQGATAALQDVKQKFGSVPEGLSYFHVGDKVIAMQMQDPMAGFDYFNTIQKAQGLPTLTHGQYASMPATSKVAALDFTRPKNQQGQIDQSTLLQAKTRLETLEAQPQFNGKDALVKQLQQELVIQQNAVDAANKAKVYQATVEGQAQGAQAQAAQPGQTAAKVAETKALAGPEAAAAGAKAEAVAKGTAKGQMEAMGNAKDAQGNWNQASLPVMLVEGNADPSQIKNARQGMTAQQVEQMASQYSMEKYGKPFDMAQAQIDYKYATNPTTQNTLKYLNALTGSDNKSGNLGQLVQQSNGITRTQFPALNDAAAWSRLQAGDPAMAAYHATVTEVADQVAKILQGGGSGTSDAKMRQAQELFQTGFNKDQITSVAETLRGLLANRKTELIGGNRYLQKQYGAQTQQPQGQPVYVGGKIAGYTTDGKTMVPVQ